MTFLHAGGCGVEQDDTESARWNRLAAVQGDGTAQAKLRDMYATGEGGVQQDAAKADKWYRRAVEPGTYDPRNVAGVEIYSGRFLMFHLFVLGNNYRNGTGAPGGDVAAYKWFDILNRWNSVSGWRNQDLRDGLGRPGSGEKREILGAGAGEEQLLEQFAEVPVRFAPVRPGGFHQAVEQCARGCPARAA